jgi:diguanylate cyclase (GGDEF)-like protein
MADRLRDEEGRLAALRRYELTDPAVDEPIGRVIELVQQILDVPLAMVALVGHDRRWVRASGGMRAEAMPLPAGFGEETIRSYHALSVADTHDDWRFAINPLVTGAPAVRSYLGVPLSSPDGYNVAVLCAFDTRVREFTEQQADILRKLGEIVVEQFDLQQIAKQDAMTGALTRRGFLAEVEREFLRATRYERPSALAMIDVDNFRAINDRYGHPAGDAVLIAIADACMPTMRKSDIFGRVGGEEFGLLLPETDAPSAMDAAERIRGIIEQTLVESAGNAIRATVSIGVAPIPAAGEGASTWLSEADIALYEAKQFGRNRVVAGKARRPAPLPTDPDRQARHLN